MQDQVSVVMPKSGATAFAPRVTVTRGSLDAPDYMAIAVRLNGGMTEASAWFSADQARRIGRALIMQANAADAARVQVAA